MSREFKPITVNELISQLEFVRDVLDGGELEIGLRGAKITKDGKVYGASGESSFETGKSQAYLIISEEYKETYPEYIGVLYNGNFIKAD